MSSGLLLVLQNEVEVRRCFVLWSGEKRESHSLQAPQVKSNFFLF
jgi:hypothetical protein